MGTFMLSFVTLRYKIYNGDNILQGDSKMNQEMNQDRYSRQMLYKHIGVEGQRSISQKHVMIVGMGALGTHVSRRFSKSRHTTTYDC